MANDANVVALSGRITRPPELRHTGTGKPVTELRIANNRSKKEGEQWVDDAGYYSIIVWERLAELAVQKMKTGDFITVTGRLNYRTWTDTTTQAQREKVEVVANTVEGEWMFRSSDTVAEQPPPAEQPAQQQQAAVQPPPATTPPPSGGDDDIPF